MTEPPLKMPDGWEHTKVYRSTDFGGVRAGEMWTPVEGGQLFVGFAVVSDGVSMLRAIMEVPTDTDEEARAVAIGEATEWASIARDWTRDCVVPNIGDTDLSDRMSETSDNISFLVASITEHVNRLAHRGYA